MPASRFQKGDLARTLEGTFTYGHRRLTPAEREANSRDPYFMELDDAGEPRLQPEFKTVKIEGGTILHVLRARVSPGDGRRDRGWMLVMDMKTGHEICVRSDELLPV